MLKIISLKIFESNKLYFLNKYSGDVYFKDCINNNKIKVDYLPPKVEKAVSLVLNPYLLSQGNNEHILENRTNILLLKYAKRLTNLTHRSFLMARLYASFRKKLFNNSSQALFFFRSLNLDKNQDELCLSRTLFAASLSREFQKSGVLFIGMHLPSDNLHSWIIENGAQADYQDKIWINYQPIAIIY